MARPSAPSITASGDKAEKPTSQLAGKLARRGAGPTTREIEGSSDDEPIANDRVSGLHLLRGLVAENLVLRREVAELRLLTADACHDPMTGLGNRRFLRQRLAEELSRTQRRTEHVGALVLVRVADMRALARGADRRPCLEAIQALAQGFRATLRVADICCRVGFGSFGFLLPDTDAAGAARVVRRLRAASMRVSARSAIPVSVAFGSSLWPADGMTSTSVWARAERALLVEDKGRTRTGTETERPSEAQRRAGAKGRLKVIRGGLVGG